jgi:hypothetical protein
MTYTAPKEEGEQSSPEHYPSDFNDLRIARQDIHQKAYH